MWLSMSSEIDRRDDILNIFRNNPHIRSLNFGFSYIDLLPEIINMLPNLEYLILRSASDFGSKPLRFEQVKHVEFEQVRPYSMQMISFPRMESLKISIGAEYCDTYAEFFERHKGLKVLHLVWRRNGEFNRYMYLISLLPELIKLTIESINHINIDMIKEIISSHEQLMALELFFPHAVYIEMEHDLVNLRTELEDWYITERDCTEYLAKKIQFDKV